MLHFAPFFSSAYHTMWVCMHLFQSEIHVSILLVYIPLAIAGIRTQPCQFGPRDVYVFFHKEFDDCQIFDAIFQSTWSDYKFCFYLFRYCCFDQIEYFHWIYCFIDSFCFYFYTVFMPHFLSASEFLCWFHVKRMFDRFQWCIAAYNEKCSLSMFDWWKWKLKYRSFCHRYFVDCGNKIEYAKWFHCIWALWTERQSTHFGRSFQRSTEWWFH